MEPETNSTTQPADERICNRCPEPIPKPLSEFGVDRSKPDGRAIYCKVCNRAAVKGERVKRRTVKVAQLNAAKKASGKGSGKQIDFAFTDDDDSIIREVAAGAQPQTVNIETLVERVRELLRQKAHDRIELRLKLQLKMRRRSDEDDAVGDALAHLWSRNEAKPMSGGIWYLREKEAA